MSRHTENAHILIANVSLEFEKTEVNSGFFSRAEERQKMVVAESRFTDRRVRQINELKNRVCGERAEAFVLINQKEVDPISLDMFQKAGLVGIRRAKHGNMERLAADVGLWDSGCVKSQLLQPGTIFATKLLLVDEIMRAGRASSKQGPGPEGESAPSMPPL
jgi:chaperonin GroEL (HSP60 family)